MPELSPIDCAQAPEIVLLGGRGGMARQLLRFLPERSRCVDIQDFGTERRVRRALVSQLHHQAHRSCPDIDRVVFALLPQEVYARVMRLRGRRARLLQVLGHAGAGQSRTLLVPAASVLSTATEVMSGASGPVAGVHLMYGPDVTDLSRETAILCVPAWASQHHLFPAARAYLRGLLSSMGHRQVLELTPRTHDALMADVQFLSHSLFLCLGAAVRAAQGGEAYRPGDLPGWVGDALRIVQRILTQRPHVYAGIARNNPFNAPIADAWLERLSALGRQPLGHLLTSLVRLAHQVSAEARSEVGIKVPVNTPVSRYRDHLIALAPQWTGAPGVTVDARVLAHAYRDALRGPYTDWFTHLAAWFPDRQNHCSQVLIDALP